MQVDKVQIHNNHSPSFKMFNVKDEYWTSIANEVKGYMPYTYPCIEQDRKIFNKSYAEYMLSSTKIDF